MKSAQFMSKISMTIDDSNSILRTHWVSLGSDIMHFINCRGTAFEMFSFNFPLFKFTKIPIILALIKIESLFLSQSMSNETMPSAV